MTVINIKINKITKYQVKYEIIPLHQIDKIQNSINTSNNEVCHDQRP